MRAMDQSLTLPMPRIFRASIAAASHVAKGPRPFGTSVVLRPVPMMCSPLWRTPAKEPEASRMWMIAMTNHGTLVAFATARYRDLFEMARRAERSTEEALSGFTVMMDH